MANIRSAYAEVMAAFLEDNNAHTATVPLQSNTTDWKSAADAEVAGVTAKTVIGSDSSKKSSIDVAITDQGVATVGTETARSSFLTGS
ncbi:MAG: hypothetical protein IKS55_03270 [Oscillospiraceae bacterium]|nr:hypothetical protein [Oscillospiraceae bacterium]